MHILVLGAAGMAGHSIAAYLHECGHEILGFVRRPVDLFPTVTGDARNLSSLRSLIQSSDFDAVINSIGVLNQFAERDKEQAVFLNSYLPHFLADVTAGTRTQVVHISTDCVFSGASGGYREDDLRDGTTFYDRTKALGELVDNKNITLRQSIIGPDLHPEGIGLFNWFMIQKGTIRGYTKAIWTGITTLELAKVAEASILNKATGLHHMVYKEPINKYALLVLFKEHMKRGDIDIIPYENVTLDKSLVRTRYEFPYIVPDYETMVSDMADWIRAHRTWYPHYRLGD